MSTSPIEDTILSGLVFDGTFAAKTYPFLKVEYFTTEGHKAVFKLAKEHIDKYSKTPTAKELELLVQTRDLQEHIYEQAKVIVSDMCKPEVSSQWLVDEAEKFCKIRAASLAVFEAIEILDGTSKRSLSDLPEMLREAVSVNFTVELGHDYYEDYKDRLKTYKEKTDKFPFHLDILNKITNGGVERKTLNLLAGPTGGGKSIWLADTAYHYTRLGFNCVYFTFELSEIRIAERIDSNALNITMNKVRSANEVSYLSKFEALKTGAIGTLKIKEMITGQDTVNDMVGYLKELEIQEGFVPDIIVVDYLTIVGSIRTQSSQGMYSVGKSVAEEILGMAKVYNVPVISAAQLNRDGQNNSDIGLDNIAESHGISQTADLMLGLMPNKELSAMNKTRLKILKNRYGSVDVYSSFVLGLDTSHMRFFDVDHTDDVTNTGDSPTEVPLNPKPRQGNFNTLNT